MTNDDESCQTCRYFQAPENGRERGECRRSPPRGTTLYEDAWPTVLPAEWCGQWSRRVGRNEFGIGDIIAIVALGILIGALVLYALGVI